MKSLLFAASVWALAGAAAAAPASPPPSGMPPAEYKTLSHDILKELIEINSTHAHGSTVAAQAIAKRLLDAGYPARRRAGVRRAA